MSACAETIYQEVVEENFDICRRCFKTSQSKSQMDSVGGGASCGNDCGTLSATLEDEPVNRSEILIRAPRLLNLILEHGYDVDGDAFNDAIDILAGVDERPEAVFLDAIRIGTGQLSTQDLMDEYNIASEDEQITQQFLRELPAADISEEDLRDVEEEVVSAVAAVTESHRPGSNVYYLSEPEEIPDEYQPVSRSNPRDVMRTVVEESESWFFRASRTVIEDWLNELEDEFREWVAPCLFSRIRSRQRYSRSDTPPPEEQFRSTNLWPLLKEDAEDIMGFLRRNDDPQTVEEIAEEVDLSVRTTRTVMTILRSAQPVEDGSSDLWKALSRDSI